ncbi:hypothetical protein ACEWPM_009590 [Roseovarius sp. S4756]|uniref:hypothetical protein n=1 Tax=Roseovarius maritimus TaxID=3342637 RepID=UPI003B673729
MQQLQQLATQFQTVNPFFAVPIDHHGVDQAMQFLAGAPRYILVGQGIRKIINMGSVDPRQIFG